jgi:hypothetical protein
VLKNKIIWQRVRIDRILLAAIALSLAWHLFWMFAVKVVVAPENKGGIKFSKVSFLGPILERGALEVRVAHGERAFLEKRYLALAGKMIPLTEETPKAPSAGSLAETDAYASIDARLSRVIKEAVSSSKLEPNYEIK